MSKTGNALCFSVAGQPYQEHIGIVKKQEFFLLFPEVGEDGLCTYLRSDNGYSGVSAGDVSAR